MSPTHDLPRHRFSLLLLGLPPRVPVQIFQDLAVLPHVRVNPCRAHFLVAVQHLPPYDLLPSSSVAIPARSSLTTAPAPSDESRGVLVLRKCLGQHPLPRAQLLVSLPRAPFRALARAGQSTPRLTSECHCSYGSLIVRIRNGMLRVSATIYSASMARSRQEPHQHRGLAGRIASSRSLAHEAGTSSPSAMWSQLTIRTVSRSESVACGTTMKPCMRPRQGQNPRRTVRVMPLSQEPRARCSLCGGARPLWIAWCHKAALAGMGRCAPHTVTSSGDVVRGSRVIDRGVARTTCQANAAHLVSSNASQADEVASERCKQIHKVRTVTDSHDCGLVHALDSVGLAMGGYRLQ